MDESRICTICGIRKLIDCFAWRNILKNYREGRCKECHSKQRREEYQINPEKYRMVKKVWRQNNPEKAKSNDKKWYVKYYKQKAILNKNWWKSNPKKSLAKSAKRRADKLNRTPKWADLEAIKQFYLNCPKGKVVDHIVPLRGKIISGLHVLSNLQYLTHSENSKKHNKYPYNVL
jgi:hypothetical protein